MATTLTKLCGLLFWATLYIDLLNGSTSAGLKRQKIQKVQIKIQILEAAINDTITKDKNTNANYTTVNRDIIKSKGYRRVIISTSFGYLLDVWYRFCLKSVYRIWTRRR